jgi:hypothetical protein
MRQATEMDEFFLPAVQPIAVDLAQMTSRQHMTLAELNEIERVTQTTQTCGRCTAAAVVLWECSPMCAECFLHVSIGRATGRDDLYLMIRTLDPIAANWVIRSILRRLAKPINKFQ